MDPTNNHFRPQTEVDWEKWRPVFTRLYMDEGRHLPEVMQIMKDEHNVWAR